MTIQQIEKLGFPFSGGKLRPRQFYFECLSKSLNIPDYYQIDEIHKMILEEGIKRGVEIGRQEKTNEIRNALGMKSLTNTEF